jgi:hypothetical protein
VLSYDKESIEEHDSPTLEDIQRPKSSGRRLWIDVQGLGDEDALETVRRRPEVRNDLLHLAGISGMNFERARVPDAVGLPGIVDLKDVEGRRNGALLLAQGVDRP